MQEILEFIIKNITTVPADVKIETQIDAEGATNYLISVNPEDVGRIIGKEGKVIKAIRTIMRVIAIREGVHIRISVLSENEPQIVNSAPISTPEEPIVEEVKEPVVEDDGSITVEV